MNEIKLIASKKLQPAIERMNELIERANAGDKHAEKVLRFAQMYGVGSQKIKAIKDRLGRK